MKTFGRYEGKFGMSLKCVETRYIEKKINLTSFKTLFGMGGGKNYPPPPLAKILNNTKFGQAEGLPELFTEQNLVLHVF